MNASKFLISSVAALSVVGALSLANAQMNPAPPAPGTTQGDTTTQMNNGSTAPNSTVNNAPATTPPPDSTINNAPTTTDPMLPAQADRN